MNHDQDLNFIPVIRFSSVVVFDESLRVLLVCERKAGIEGLWGTPGGGDEPGEIPVQAAKRELYEETGLKNIELSLLETLLWHGDRGDILMCHIFSPKFTRAFTLRQSSPMKFQRWAGLTDRRSKQCTKTE